MSDLLTVTGIVLSAMPVGDYDRRLLLLTAERGKISAFAKGARRPNSPFVAGSRALAFGSFTLYEGRTTYNLKSMEIRNYFTELSQDVEAVCYSSYFCEFADYYGREGVDGREMINILYAALLALKRGEMDRKLIRYVYELKMMASQGEYSEEPFHRCHEAAAYAWQYVLMTPPKNLFSFNLKPDAAEEFYAAVNGLKNFYIDREFKSLEVLNALSS